jgi:outer membrane beta-barrel protein
MKRRFVKAGVAALAVAGAMSAAGAAQAEEVELTGPLKGAPAVRHMRLYREGRFELAPTVSFSLLDQYRRTFFIGGRLTYNIKDWLGIGVWGGYGVVSSNTDLATEIDNPVSGSPRDPLTAINVNHSGAVSGGYAPFTDQTAKMNWVLTPQITFVPFRGKLAIFNKIFVDADFYVAPGVGIIGIQERGDCGPAPAGGTSSIPVCSSPSSFALTSKTKFTATFAVGFTFYPADLLSIGVEYRALPFSWNRSGFDSRGSGTNGNFPDNSVNSQDETFDFNQMITVSVGFALPVHPKVSE